MKKSLKRNSLKRKRKSVKKKLKGGGLVEEIKKTKLLRNYKEQIIKYIDAGTLTEKNDTLLKTITNKIRKTGQVYDFIFDTINNTQVRNSDVIIWSHGTKNKLEPLTAGKRGIHAYIQKNGENINLLGLVLNISS